MSDEMIAAALGVAFAAFCIWLTVRIVNRQERWAKWMLAAVVGIPVLYVVSFGPACWWLTKPLEVPIASYVTVLQPPLIYKPIGWSARLVPDSFGIAINWYATVGAGDYAIMCGFDDYGRSIFWAGGYGG